MKINSHIEEDLTECKGTFYYEDFSLVPFNHFKWDTDWIVLLFTTDGYMVIPIEALSPREAVIKAILHFQKWEEENA